MSTSTSGAVRLGRRKPNEDELLTEQQIHDMIEEMVESFKDPEITKDPFISPALADDKYLIGLPFMHIFVSTINCSILHCYILLFIGVWSRSSP